MNILWWGIAALVTFAHAEDPRVPGNLHFADVCRYGLADARLTCLDRDGNVLIDRVRVYGLHVRWPYDELGFIALMKREGFDLGARVTPRPDARSTLYFQKNGCGR